MMDLSVAAYKGRHQHKHSQWFSRFSEACWTDDRTAVQCTGLIRCLLQHCRSGGGRLQHCRSGDRWVLQLIGCMQNADQCSGPPSARATARLTRTRDIQFAHFLLQAAAQGKLIRTNQWIMRIDEASQTLCYVKIHTGKEKTYRAI